MKKYLLSTLLVFPVPPLFASPIIGAWVHNNGIANDSDVLVFLPNGIYFHAEDGSGASDTMERGTFSWDEATSQLSLTPITVAGASELPASLYFPIVGNQAEGGEFQRVTSAHNPLVGGWSFGDTTQADTNSGVLVFLENGVYFNAQDVEADPPYFQDGMERGTYTWDPATRAFSNVQTADTNGEVGISDPRTSFKISVQGDDLVIQEGFLKFVIARATAISSSAGALNEAQSFMVSDEGMFGVMVATVPGFFYTVDRSSNLGEADVTAGIEGTGTMSGMVLETDPAIIPRAFFTTRVEVQSAVASAEIADFLNGQSVDGVSLLADGTWTKGAESGLWSYEVPDAGTGVLQLTSNADGNDPAQSRTEYAFDFSSLDGFEEIPTVVRSFMGETETEMRTLDANLDPNPDEPDLAPSPEEFVGLVGGKTIKGINFAANNRWTAFGEAGNWGYSATSPSTATLTITFDEDSNDPLIARDDYLLTFTEAGGTSQVAARVEISDNNFVDEVQNVVLDLTKNTFAPTPAIFTYLLEDRVINSTVFDEDGTFVFNGNEGGRWTAVSVGDHQILLTQTYDEDGNDPQAYREESLLTFDGTTTVALNYREFDGGQLDFEVNTSVTFD